MNKILNRWTKSPVRYTRAIEKFTEFLMSLGYFPNESPWNEFPKYIVDQWVNYNYGALNDSLGIEKFLGRKEEKIVYILHPILEDDLSKSLEEISDTVEGIFRFMEGIVPIAPYFLHNISVQSFKDKIQEGANNILRSGIVDEVWVYGVISPEMEEQIDLALMLGILVDPKTEQAKRSYQNKIVKMQNSNDQKVFR